MLFEESAAFLEFFGWDSPTPELLRRLIEPPQGFAGIEKGLFGKEEAGAKTPREIRLKLCDLVLAQPAMAARAARKALEVGKIARIGQHKRAPALDETGHGLVPPVGSQET